MDDTDKKNYPSPAKVILLGLFHILWASGCGVLIYKLWPPNDKIVNLSDKDSIVLVLLAGAIGSFIHSAGSFVTFVGNKKLNVTWMWWYLLRPLIGMGIALVFFIIFRAGLLAGTNTAVNIYGLLALSALAGMFSDRATLKLQEIFETLFKPDDKRGGKISGKNGGDKDFENSAAQG